MLQWRCVNDVCFGYCKGHPTFDQTSSTCKLNSRNCGKYLLFSEMLKPVKLKSCITKPVTVAKGE